MTGLEVLRRAYGERVRTLQNAIVSILPPPKPTNECTCRGNGCLGCAHDPSSFLLRSEDDAEYAKLLTRGFAVWTDGSTPVIEFFYQNHWTQIQLVRSTIDLMIFNLTRRASSNVICLGYEKQTRCSHIVDILSSSPWTTLLSRIGDIMMVHLLRFASIYLLISRNAYFQVAGVPIHKFLQSSTFLGNIISSTRSGMEQALVARHRFQTYEDAPKSECISGQKKRKRAFSWQHQWRQQLKHGVSYENNQIKVPSTDNHLEMPMDKDTNELYHAACDKRKFDCNNSGYDTTPVDSNSREEACGLVNALTSSSAYRNLKDRMFPTKVDMRHFVHSMCCYSQEVKGNTLVMRGHIFYNATIHRTVLPTEHILLKLKPNDHGAVSLMNNVFCMFEFEKSTFSPLVHRDANCMFQLQNLSFFCIAQFCNSYTSENFCISFRPKVLQWGRTVLKWFKTLIRNVQHCHFFKLLERHCPIRSVTSSTRQSHKNAFKGSGLELSSNSSFRMTNAITVEEASRISSSKATKHCHMSLTNNSYSKHKEVVSFVWAVCRNVVPIPLLGSSCNWRALRQNIALFVRLRRFEKISLKHCMHKVQTSHFSFPSELICVYDMKKCKGNKLDSGDHLTAKKVLWKKLVEIWVMWLFSCFIGPLLKANFYITECEKGRHDVFYYRKVIWKKKVKNYMDTLENQKFLTHGSEPNEKSYFYPKMRFLPKDDGLRPLVSYRLKPDYISGLNIILKGIKMKHPQLFGSSVYDYDDIYRKFLPFFVSLKTCSLCIPRIFIITCDVSKAFDSVDHNKLLHMMKGVLYEEEYYLKKFIQVRCSGRSILVECNHLLVDHNKPGHAVFACKSKSSAHSVLVDEDSVKKIKRKGLLDLLEKHIRGNIWKLGGKFYVREIGISQGSMISPLLCSFYYGHLERNIIFPSLENHHIPPACKSQSGRQSVSLTQMIDLDHPKTARVCELNDGPMNQPSSFEEQAEDLLVRHATGCQIKYVAPPKFLLLRLVDDFIFISSSLDQATNFFLKMSKGFEEYNCHMNHEKFNTNFNSSLCDTKSLKATFIDDDSANFIPWCGLLINSHTLEIQADYTRYLGIHLRSTLTVWRGSKPGQHLKKSLCYYMLPKCHPLLYDSNINSGAVVRLNAYQAFLLCAMKFHCYVCSTHGISFNPTSYMEMIENSISYMCMLIKRRIDCFSSCHPILQLEKAEVQCLALSAYVRVLKRKQSRHKVLLSQLKSKAERYQVLFQSPDMRYAVEDSHSSVFWKIKY